MRIEDLIKEIKGENIQLQWLHNCMKGSSTNKKNITTINILTDFTTNDILDPKGKTAMILWVDKRVLDKSFNKLKKKASSSEVLKK